MAYPKSKNKPKKGLRPLGIKVEPPITTNLSECICNIAIYKIFS
jgi:hypothetical protein